MFTETRLNGAFLLELEEREDDRGFFARSPITLPTPTASIPEHWQDKQPTARLLGLTEQGRME